MQKHLQETKVANDIEHKMFPSWQLGRKRGDYKGWEHQDAPVGCCDAVNIAVVAVLLCMVVLFVAVEGHREGRNRRQFCYFPSII